MQYVLLIGKSLNLSESCFQNENVPNFSFLSIGSASAAGRHNRSKYDEYARVIRQ
jgi:hypothetical protein